MTHQTYAGHKAHQTKVFLWGPDEPNRAARLAADIRAGIPRALSLNTREAVYSAADFARAAARREALG